MRLLRRPSRQHPQSYLYKRRRGRASLGLLFSAILLLSTTLLPNGAAAAPRPHNAPSPGAAPLVSGASYTITGANFQSDSESAQATEKSFKGDLTVPAGKQEVAYISGPTQAPISFTDIGPYWQADTPPDTSVLVEMRTGPDGHRWHEWQAVDEEDIIMPTDVLTQTYGSMVAVDQVEGTHRYVQTRVTLRTAKPGVSPVFRSLTYTFINAGVTPNQPRAQMMIQGTPSEVPKPLMVSRKEWGSPQGASSPRWKPKYKRVTHVIVHHTATSNADTDHAARVRAIWYFHTHTRGWGDIGYNYVIDPNGVIYEGRAGGDDVEAGHAYPFNAGSMGVGMLGNFMKVAPSAAAQAALIDIISWKANQRGIDPLAIEPLKGYTECGGSVTYVRPTIAGHRDYKGNACGRSFNNSTCPGDRLYDLLPQIRAAVISEQPPLRASFMKHDTPGNIAPGAALNVNITVRNSGSQLWQARGQGAVALGYQWLTPEGKPLAGATETKALLPNDVQFAEIITLTARLSAPAATGHYALIWDMYQEGTGWFAAQGTSRPLRVDVVIGTSTADKFAPKSSVLPLPVYSSDTQINVRWAGEDETKGSGIASYDVQYRIAPSGGWTDWQSATSKTQSIFEAEDGYTYEFRSRARDAAGNVEAWPDKAQVYTTVDTRPPDLSIDKPENRSHVKPGPVTVIGKTEMGAFVVVNDKRAEVSGGVYTSTVEASGRDFIVHVSAADPAGNVASLEVVVQAAPRYNDVGMDHPAFLAIEQLSDKGIITGHNDGSFKPDAPLTRAQLAKMLTTAMQWGLIKPPEGRFSDVPADSWMYPYVETVVARGVLKGYPDGTFKPGGSLTRAEVVRAVVIAAGWKPDGANTFRMADVPPHSVDAPYISLAHRRGLIAPDEDRQFRPYDAATREDATLIVYKLLKYIQAHNPSRPGDGE